MKNMGRIGKWACGLGMVYSLWLGGNVHATDGETRSALVIVALCIVIWLQMVAQKHGAGSREA